MESHYREQAAACEREAAATALGHVRDRFLRAQAAWLTMADRAARASQFRAATRSTAVS